MHSILKYGALTAVGALLSMPVMAQNLYNNMDRQTGQNWKSDQHGNRFESRSDSRYGQNRGSSYQANPGWTGGQNYNTGNDRNQYGQNQYGQNQYGRSNWNNQNQYGQSWNDQDRSRQNWNDQDRSRQNWNNQSWNSGQDRFSGNQGNWNQSGRGWDQGSRDSNQGNWNNQTGQGWSSDQYNNRSENWNPGQNQYRSDQYGQNQGWNSNQGSNEGNYTQGGSRFGNNSQGWSGYDQTQKGYGMTSHNEPYTTPGGYGYGSKVGYSGQTGYSNNYVPEGTQSNMPRASMNGYFTQNPGNESYSTQQYHGQFSQPYYGQGNQQYTQGSDDRFGGQTHTDDFTGNRE